MLIYVPTYIYVNEHSQKRLIMFKTEIQCHVDFNGRLIYINRNLTFVRTDSEYLQILYVALWILWIRQKVAKNLLLYYIINFLTIIFYKSVFRKY